ncbi:hypothetical protein PFISCL1PPCAC_11240, partial [Pristionchus fissidentatus]
MNFALDDASLYRLLYSIIALLLTTVLLLIANGLLRAKGVKMHKKLEPALTEALARKQRSDAAAKSAKSKRDPAAASKEGLDAPADKASAEPMVEDVAPGYNKYSTRARKLSSHVSTEQPTESEIERRLPRHFDPKFQFNYTRMQERYYSSPNLATGD